jgi:Skp family chaperone for outer membrane proteins
MVVTRQVAGEHRGMATDPARPDPPKKHRSRWIWVSGLLALACVGLLVWALSLNSDLDDANAKNAQAAETGSSIAGKAKDAYDQLASELGSTNEDLANTEQQLADAQKQAEDAQKQADEAQQKAENTDDELQKAQAEAEQAKAEADAAGSKAKVAAECAKAYISAAGGLLDGEDRESVKSKLQSITSDCQAAFADAGAG